MVKRRGFTFWKRQTNSFQNILILYVTCVTRFEIVNGVATTANRFQRTSHTLLENTYATFKADSGVECCRYCDQTSGCKSVNFDNSSKECQLSRDPLVAVGVKGNMDTEWSTYSKDDWMLVFRGTPGAGGDIYTAWTDGASVTTDNITCMTTDVTSCSQHYRDPIVDSWISIGMTQVKFAFYKDNNEVAFVIFDATGSDITNWFISSRITQSSWMNITSDEFNYFSILGDTPGRRFFINRTYGGCPSDTTYTVVVSDGGPSCSYDFQTSYPQFLYANTETYGYPETMTGMDTADVMAIFIK